MSKVLSGPRLSKLRRAAVKRGVFDRSVHPRKRLSYLGGILQSAVTLKDNVAVPNYALIQEAFIGDITPQKTSIAIKAIIREILGEDVVRPALHQRSREIYGDEYAPVYDVALQEDNCRKVEKREKLRYLRKRAKRCKSCVTHNGKGCTRLRPSPSGSALALEVLALRAIQYKPTQRRLKDALVLPRSPPGPSPLAKSFTPGGCEDDDSDGPEGSDYDATASNCSSLSRKDLSMRREFGMYIVKDQDLAYVGDRGVFSPGYTYFDVTGVYPGPDKQIVSYIQGPIPPGWDGDEHESTTTIEEVCSETDARHDDKSNSRTNLDDLDNKQYVSGHSVSISLVRSLPSGHSVRRTRTQSFGSAIQFDPAVGWRRLRSMGSGLIKRRSAHEVAC